MNTDDDLAECCLGLNLRQGRCHTQNITKPWNFVNIRKFEVSELALTQQLIHAPYAYSFLLIPCLLITYKALTKPLPITHQSLTNSAYSLPFLYFNAVSPHVFKPPGLSLLKKVCWGLLQWT